ncbi:MAG: hypothetical protein H6585_14090 [Flavobacteriales bacterium]|nr:hypothetical protein [Flavobacteriales bacterium]MCB9449460.1 hypothetical protein [Flavobacteriales bacterium]
MKKICWLIGMICLAGGFLFAQEYPHDFKRYPFVQYDINTLETFGNHPYEALFRKMDSLYFYGKGQVNIVHIGGSHIQADIWSGRLRERLQESVPGCNGGRGLVFPFSVAKTNNPWNYKSKYTGSWSACRNVQRSRDCQLGMTGIEVETNDLNATVRIIPVQLVGETEYPSYDFFRVKVFCSLDSASYGIIPSDTTATYIQRTDTTAGYVEFTFSRFLDTLDLKLARLDTLQNHFTLFGITLETNDPGFIYHAIGVNGASVPSYLRCGLFSKELAMLKPDLVVFSIGINDAYESDFSPARYEQNYDSLITMVREAAPNAAILFTTNNDSYKRRRNVNRNGLLVKDAMERMARRYQAGVWDLFSVMGGLDSIRQWEKYGLAQHDKIHFTRTGYVYVGDLMYSAIMKAYEAHLGKEEGAHD